MNEQEKIEKIRKAHQDGTEKDLHSHFSGKYIGDIVYGANDGIITTFAVVSAVTGAALSPLIIMIIGFANLFADGFSMAAGAYLSSKSEKEYVKNQREMEEWEVKHLPEEERKEIKDIYRAKGFKGKLLDDVVKVLTRNKKIWVDTMMLEELRITDEDDNALVRGFVTFVAFVIAGFMPLLPYAFAIEPLFKISVILTGLTLFLVGAGKTLVTGGNWLKNGIEMLLVGTLAASVAYGVGWLLRGLT